jgi:hypothetical protein
MTCLKDIIARRKRLSNYSFPALLNEKIDYIPSGGGRPLSSRLCFPFALAL